MLPARMRAGLAVALGYSVVAAHAKSTCEISGWAYAVGVEVVGNFTSSTSCRDACQVDVNCSVYGYYAGTQQCFVSDPTSPLVKQAVGVDVVAGPVDCEGEMSPCSGQAAPSSWPAATEAESMSAWPVGFQPQANQCYDSSTCTAPPLTLQDVATGWENTCVGMTDKTAELVPGVSCEEDCLADESCPAFQVGLNNTCWQGIGVNCSVPPDWNSTFKPTAGKRYQRGSVRSLRSLVGVQVMNLQQIFGVEQMQTVADPADECFKTCASILYCQYWQLSNKTGCWIEAAQGQVEYPLVQGLNGYHEDGEFAPDMVAGQYLQRFCPDEHFVGTEEEEEGEEFPAGPILLGLFSVCVCIAISLVVMYFMGCFKKKKGKKDSKKKNNDKRSLKVAPSGQQQPLVQPGQMSLFDQLDTNHDGVITKEEFMRSVQVGSLVAPGVQPAPGMQPLPTMAAPMPAYQVVPGVSPQDYEAYALQQQQPAMMQPQPGYVAMAQPAYGMPPGPPMPYPPMQQ